jgi:hypothetical protein
MPPVYAVANRSTGLGFTLASPFIDGAGGFGGAFRAGPAGAITAKTSLGLRHVIPVPVPLEPVGSIVRRIPMEVDVVEDRAEYRGPYVP